MHFNPYYFKRNRAHFSFNFYLFSEKYLGNIVLQLMWPLFFMNFAVISDIFLIFASKHTNFGRNKSIPWSSSATTRISYMARRKSWLTCEHKCSIAKLDLLLWQPQLDFESLPLNSEKLTLTASNFCIVRNWRCPQVNSSVGKSVKFIQYHLTRIMFHFSYCDG